MAIEICVLSQEKQLLIEIPTQELRFTVGLSPDGKLYYSDDKCPHRGGPLHLSYLDDQGVKRCPWHDRPVPDRCNQYKSASFIANKNQRKITIVTTEPDLMLIKEINASPLCNEQIVAP